MASRVLLVVVPIAVLAYGVLVPQVNLNSSTVAAALEAQAGDKTLIDCNPSGDEWLCTEHFLSQPRGTCQVGTRSPHSPMLTQVGLVSVAPAAAPCVEIVQQARLRAERKGDRVVAQDESGRAGAILSAPDPRKTLANRVWDWLSAAPPET